MANIQIVRVLISLLMCIAFLAIPSANVQAAAPPDPAWWARWGSPYSHRPQAIVADSQGNCYVTGYSWTGSYRQLYATVKYGSGYTTGQPPAWAVTWNLAGVDANFAAYDIAVDSTGVYVTGCGYDAGYNNLYYTLKYDLATGAPLWASPATCPGEEGSSPPRIAVDDTGVYISGSTWRSVPGNSSEDYVTIKYNKSTGAVLWGPVYYDGAAANDNDYARDIAVYSSGVYVTGYSEKEYEEPASGNYFDIATVKYDSTTGAQSWEHRIFTYDEDAQDEAYIAADSSGVYVSAASYIDDNRDTMTVKYPLGSATPLWGPKYYGGEYDDDVPAGIAIDSSGIYVTGNVEDESGDDRYYTRKYASSDGEYIWARSYAGHPCDDRGIAVDSTGVYVSGYIRITDSPQYYEYATIKYGLADGAEAWSGPALFSGESASYGSYAFAMAADGGGGVYVTGYGYYIAEDQYNYLTVKYGTSLPVPTVPTVTAVNPASGNQGQCPKTVVITGTNFTGATAVSFGAGITVSGFVVNSATQITATICIAPGAALGARNVSVTTPGGTGTKTGAFTVGQQSIGTGTTTPMGGSSAPAAINVAPVPLTNIVVQGASLSSTTASPGSPVTVTADITNKSTVNGNKKVTVYVNGEIETAQGVNLNSGSSSQLTFNISRSEPGTYKVYVDGVQAGSFKVEAVTANDIILIISILLLAIAFVTGLLMLWRRRQEYY